MLGLLAAEVFRPRPPEVPASEAPFVEPSDGSIRYRPWGAVPANPFIDEEVRARQIKIDAEFQKLFDHPPEDVPEAFARMLADDHMVGEERRKMKNYEAYMEWLKLRQPISEEIDVKVSHHERGTAYIGEILDFALATDVETFEGGKITHPYSQRLEYVEPFREEFAEALEARGGIVYPKVSPYHSITIIPDVVYHEDGSHSLNGFIARYKRDFGSLDLADGSARIHITERQLAGIRIDEESGFDQDIIKKMLASDISSSRSWQKRYMQYIVDTGARGFIEKAIQNDSTAKFFVPESTMIYGFKEKLATPISKGLGQVALRKPSEDNGIAYFGPLHHATGKVPIQAQQNNR